MIIELSGDFRKEFSEDGNISLLEFLLIFTLSKHVFGMLFCHGRYTVSQIRDSTL